MKLTKSQLKQIIKEVLLEGFKGPLRAKEAEAAAKFTPAWNMARNRMVHRSLTPDQFAAAKAEADYVVARFLDEEYPHDNISQYILSHCEAAESTRTRLDAPIQWQEILKEHDLWKDLDKKAQKCIEEHINRQEAIKARPPGSAVTDWYTLEYPRSSADFAAGTGGYGTGAVPFSEPVKGGTAPMPRRKLEQMIKEELAQVLRESPWRP